MSYVERHSLTLTTDASGDAEGYLPQITGEIINVIYDKVDFADGVDFTITVESTGQQVWAENDVNASKTVAPRQPIHTTAGVAALYAAAGEAVLDRIAVAQDRIKVVVASGGNAKSGTFTVIVR